MGWCWEGTHTFLETVRKKSGKEEWEDGDGRT